MSSTRLSCAAIVTACVLSGSFVAKANPLPASPSGVESGDLLFVSGQSLRAKLVDLFQFGEAGFSHVGMLVRSETQGLMVLHAEPDAQNGFGRDGIIMEEWSRFMQRGEVGRFAIYRVSADRATIERAVATGLAHLRQETPFDHRFDRADATQMYCTEFIERAFAESGLMLTGADKDDREILLPRDLLSSHLTIEVPVPFEGAT